MKIQIVKKTDDKVNKPYIPIYVQAINSLEPASCMEINMGNILDFHTSRVQIFSTLVSKLRYGGQISLIGNDLLAISRGLSLGCLTPKQGADLLYNGRVACDTLNGVIEICKTFENLKIIQQNLVQYQYGIIMERVKP